MIKKITWFVLLLITTAYMVACTSMGASTASNHANKIVSSAQYNSDSQQFQNPEEISLQTGRPWTTIAYEYLFNGHERRPKEKLPEAPPALSELDSKSRDIRFIWFGHSTILLELDGKRILIDPVFSTYASPLAGIAKRFQPPVFNIDEIQNIDIVLISHDHYDHLDHKTISKLKKRDLHYIVPLGVGAHLEHWGIKKEKITELDWWEDTAVNDLTFTCTPSQHFSGRGLFNRNTTLWASWAIKGSDQNVFYSGDSGYSGHYKEIGERLGPFDLTFLENGAYSLDWKYVHQLPEEGVQGHIDLKGKAMVPVHWGMFDLSLHTWHEPIERVTREANKRGVKIIAPKLGQLVSEIENFVQTDWWSPIIEKENDLASLRP